MQIKKSLLIGTLLIGSNAYAIDLFNQGGTRIALAGRVNIAVIGDNTDGEGRDPQLLDNGSWLDLYVDKRISNEWTAGAHMEWAVNMIAKRDVIGYSYDSSSVAIADDTQALFSNRLGYVHFESPTWGVFQLGKTKSVYLEATEVVDVLNVYSDLASATYSFGDGGIAGTGRADQAIKWKHLFGIGEIDIEVGFQTQLMEDEFNVLDDNLNTIGEIVHTGGNAAKLGVGIGNLFLRTAVATTDLNGEINGVPVDDAQATTASFVWEAESLYIAGVYTQADNLYQDEQGALFDGIGYEFIVAYRFGQWQPLIGINEIHSDDTLYNLNTVTLSLNYLFPNTSAKFFLDAGYDHGSFSTGEESNRDFVALGLLYRY